MAELAPCPQDLRRYGTTEGIYPWTKEQAEAYCAAERDRTGDRVDWFFVAGRAVVKRLPGDVYILEVNEGDLEALHAQDGLPEDLAKRINSLWIDMTTEELP